jgi:hypothetical protein
VWGAIMLQGLLEIKDTHRPLGWSYAPRHSPTVGRALGRCVFLISSNPCSVQYMAAVLALQGLLEIKDMHRPRVLQ